MICIPINKNKARNAIPKIRHKDAVVACVRKSSKPFIRRDSLIRGSMIYRPFCIIDVGSDKILAVWSGVAPTAMLPNEGKPCMAIPPIIVPQFARRNIITPYITTL